MTTVYRIFGERNRLLYVGVTDKYDLRMRQHSEKLWWVEVRAIERVEFDDRPSALAAEAEAIRTESPKYNRQGVKEPAPRAHVPKAGRSAVRKWLSMQDAADYLGISARTLRSYTAQGLVQAHRFKSSRMLRYDLADLDDLLVPVPTTTHSGHVLPIGDPGDPR